MSTILYPLPLIYLLPGRRLARAPLFTDRRYAMPHIRPEQSDDAGAIHAVHAACFPSSSEAQLVDRLRAAGRLAVSLVAEIDGRIVGHIAFSPVTLASGAIRAAGAGLAPLAVLAAHRRRGIGADLVRAGLDACRAAGFGWVVVLGEPHYYQRFGFRPAATFGLRDEYGADDAFAAIELQPGSLPVGGGLVRYAPEFAALA